jgi:SNF2 family DNA or RNA helicase
MSLVGTAFPYPFKTAPRQHQLTCWLRQKDEKAFALFPDMGAGKTKILLDTAAWLYDADKIDTLVVLAPKSVYRNWDDEEIPKHLPAHIRYRVGVWSSEGRKSDEESLKRLTRRDGNYDLHILLVNVEALGRELAQNRCYQFLADFMLSRRVLMAIDESTAVKNPKATRTKACFALSKLTAYRRILSGNPAPNGPLDLWSQGEFLEPGYWGFNSYYSFRAHFAKLVQMRVGNRKIQRVTGFQNLDELQQLMRTKAFVVKKEDCLDLPPKVHMPPRYVEMGKQQAKAYSDMRKLAICQIENQLKDNPQTATAQIVLTQKMRLQQILCGFIVTDEKQLVPIDEPSPRMDALLEWTEQVAGKGIIWAVWKYNVREIAARLVKEYGPDSVVTYYGETSVDDRRTAIKRFQDPADPARWFISNKTGARGLTLIQGKDMLFYSHDYDWDTRSQSEDRAHRMGQDSTVTYTNLVCKGTEDEKALEALQTKLDLGKVITPSNWREFI